MTLGEFNISDNGYYYIFLFSRIARFLGGGNTFTIFVGFMILQLFFVLKMMQETKGKSLEQMDSQVLMH
jgi:hypothetical protein